MFNIKYVSLQIISAICFVFPAFLMLFLCKGWYEGGGEIQEQHSYHKQQEETPFPYPVRQVPRADRFSGQRGSARFQNCLAEI